MRDRLEYAPVWLIAQMLRMLPRPLARAAAISLAHVIRLLHRRLHRVGMRNLSLAFPEKTEAERKRILRGVYTSLGRLLAEFSKFPSYTKKNVANVAIHDGLENYLAASARGKGVLFMTAHLGGWEVGSFVHSLLGYPHNLVVRDLDNPYLDSMVRNLRTMHGNKTFDKDEFARGLLAAMRRGETVGVLMDTNMTPPQGVFVDFFGIPACTPSGVARVAMHTGAAVLPAFTIWDKKLGKYRIRFEPAVPAICTGDADADALANTAAYTKVIERFVREYPDQWLWVHRRWKTRPEGEPPLY